MKKDIQIPNVSNVYLVIVPEYNTIFKSDDWNVYLVNDKDFAIETVLIVSNGFDENRKTAQMRHKIEILPAKSAVKIELMITEVFELHNEFKITFFEANKLYDKTFLIKKKSIKRSALRMVKALHKKGIIIK